MDVDSSGAACSAAIGGRGREKGSSLRTLSRCSLSFLSAAYSSSLSCSALCAPCGAPHTTQHARAPDHHAALGAARCSLAPLAPRAGVRSSAKSRCPTGMETALRADCSVTACRLRVGGAVEAAHLHARMVVLVRVVVPQRLVLVAQHKVQHHATVRHLDPRAKPACGQHTRMRVPLARLPFCCETSDTPGSWATLPAEVSKQMQNSTHTRTPPLRASCHARYLRTRFAPRASALRRSFAGGKGGRRACRRGARTTPACP